MAQLSQRVRRDPFTQQVEVLGEFAVDLVRGKWQLYETWSDYSTTSGGFEVKGKAVRRYDSQAGDQEGKIARFTTKAEAVAYHNHYLISRASAVQKEESQ